MTVGIVRTEWTGLTGGPGLTQMAFSASDGLGMDTAAAAAAVDAVEQFWTALLASFPDELSLRVDPIVEEFDEASGVLVDVVSSGLTTTQLAGTSVQQFVGGAGIRITWLTNDIKNGRRVRGATYMVPIHIDSFEQDGTPTASFITGAQNAGNAMIADALAGGALFVVWSRPPTQPGAGGTIHNVSGAFVADKSAILRTRRD